MISLPRLPQGWHWSCLADVAELRGGIQKGKKRKPTDVTSEVPYLRVANVQRGTLELDEVSTILATEKEIERLALNDGDVLFTEGGDRDKLGRGWVWEGQIALCIHQNHVFRARPDAEKVVPHLLSYWGNTFGRDFFWEHGKQSVNLASISLRVLGSLPVPLPPLDEQRRIVAKIEALFARSRRAKEALDAIPPLLERLRQSILAAAFRGDLTADWRAQNPDVEPAEKLLERIRIERRRRWEEGQLAKMRAKGKEPKGDGWKRKYEEGLKASNSALLPVTWCWASAEECCSEITVGHVGPMRNEYTERGTPFLRSQNVRPNRFDPTGLKYIGPEFHSRLSKSQIRPGDLLVVRSGAPGTACVVPDELSDANCADLVVAHLLPGVDPHLAAFFMNSQSGKSFVRENRVGMAQQHFNVKAMRSVEWPLMPEGEQSLLRNRLRSAMQNLANLAEVRTVAAARVEDLDATVLDFAFRGHLVPASLSGSPEESTPSPGSSRGTPLPNAADYTLDDWRTCLLHATPTTPIARDEAITAAAHWARDNYGLTFKRLPANGKIVKGLKSAMNSAIRRGELLREGTKKVRRVVDEG